MGSLVQYTAASDLFQWERDRLDCPQPIEMMNFELPRQDPANPIDEQSSFAGKNQMSRLQANQGNPVFLGFTHKINCEGMST